MFRTGSITILVSAFLALNGPGAFASPQQVGEPAAPVAAAVSPAVLSPNLESRLSANEAASDNHTGPHFHWAPDSPKHPELGVNFGLLQPALGGFNIAGEVRYRRLWLEYSHGMNLTLNKMGGYSMTQTEHDQNLHIFVPYTTGFGVGFTVVDHLWLGTEVKLHSYEVNAPGGPVSSYHTLSVGPVLGYKLSIWKGLYANAFLRYWPNVATTLHGDQIALQGNGTVTHTAHDFGSFANVAIGYTFKR